MTDNLEIMINEMMYDNQIMKTIIQIFLVNTLQSQGIEGKNMVAQIKQQVTATLLPPAPHRTDAKIEQFVSMRLEKFFQVIEYGLGVKIKSNPSSVN